MGIIHYTMTSTGISFNKTKDETQYISKEEAINFIEYLRNKEDLIIDERKVKGLFNTFDFTYINKQYAKIIKESISAQDVYEKLCIIEPSSKNYNINHKYLENLNNIYEEDLYEYLTSINVKDPLKLTKIIVNNEYKEYLRHHTDNDPAISYELDMWARGCKYLPKRNMLMKLFISEYKLYVNK